MPHSCPHCGFSLPPVADPYCSNCGREIENSEENSREPSAHSGPRRRLTGTGKLIVLVYAVCAFVGAFAFIMYLFPLLPAGRYPLFMFLTPFAVIAVACCAITLRRLEKQGIAIFEDTDRL